MTKKAKTFYICLISIALSCILLLFFVMYRHAKSPKINESLTLSASDITLCVDEFKTDFYTISNPNAKIEFEYDETYVYVDKDKIQGLKAGTIEVTITATLNDAFEETVFTVTIYEKTYYYEIIPYVYCTFDSGCIYSSENNCIFAINIYDTLGDKIENPKLVFTSDKPFQIDPQFGRYVLSCSEDCIIHVETDFGYEFDIIFKKMPSLG